MQLALDFSAWCSLWPAGLHQQAFTRMYASHCVIAQAKPLSQSNEREALHQLAEYIQMRLGRCRHTSRMSSPLALLQLWRVSCSACTNPWTLALRRAVNMLFHRLIWVTCYRQVPDDGTAGRGTDRRQLSQAAEARGRPPDTHREEDPQPCASAALLSLALLCWRCSHLICSCLPAPAPVLACRGVCMPIIHCCVLKGTPYWYCLQHAQNPLELMWSWFIWNSCGAGACCVPQGRWSRSQSGQDPAWRSWTDTRA